ncbi:MAG: stage II sporulation protein M [Nanoarchaeota archaeon]|nr:stage II sporulation protein M [Nanoarchaeota archaeon]
MDLNKTLSFLDPEEIKKHPVNVIYIAAFMITIGFISAFFIFPGVFSISVISFSSLFLLPFVMRMLETEKISKRKFRFSYIFSRHKKMIIFFIFIFIGMSIEYTLLYGLVPPNIGNVAFEQQLGLFLKSPAEYVSGTEIFWGIVSNNMRLVFICMLLSIIYGVGAVFILNYNASIVGIIYGSGIRSFIWGATYPVLPHPILYLPHIIVEILAYLFASLAGAMLYKSIKLGEKSYSVFMRDSLIFLGLSIILIFVAGYIEITVPFLPR